MLLNLNKSNNIYNSEMPLEALYLSTVRDWEKYLNEKIESYKRCRKCNGLGYQYHDPENQKKIEERIEYLKRIHVEKNTFNDDLSFLDLAINIVRSSFSKRFDCFCRKRLDFFVKQKKHLTSFKDKGIDYDYEYDITFQNIENEKSLIAHILLSTFTRKKMYSGYKGLPVYATVKVLKSSDLDFKKSDELRELKPDFIYIINNGLCIKDYEYLKDRLYNYCHYLYEYKIPKDGFISKQEIIF